MFDPGIIFILILFLFLLAINQYNIRHGLVGRKSQRRLDLWSGKYEQDIDELQKKVIELEQKLEQERNNGAPGKQAPRALRRLDEGRDGPDRR